MNDLKKDAEDEWRVNVAYSKCKRARKMVLDAHFGSFTIEYSKLETYVEKLLKSNLSSSVKV